MYKPLFSTLYWPFPGIRCTQSNYTYFFLQPDERVEASFPSIHVQVHLVAPHLETLLDSQRIQGKCAKVADALVFAGGQ